ncbi:hypothetical protein ACH5RR_012616 [Cinchona calisaya]|uniref:Uncharacterized protein n=1 Tax=Cinchona calisaya TaxID=153742 RepID=A0ABD3A848_9GENT
MELVKSLASEIAATKGADDDFLDDENPTVTELPCEALESQIVGDFQMEDLLVVILVIWTKRMEEEGCLSYRVPNYGVRISIGTLEAIDISRTEHYYGKLGQYEALLSEDYGIDV